jgi:hypothetical protein
VLFPTIAWVFGGTDVGSWVRDEWFRDLRVHSDVFDRYFHFVIPVGDVSQTDIDRVLARVGERDALVSALRDLQERELLEPMLDRLEAYKQQIDVARAVPFVTALFDIGDDVAHEGPGFFEIAPHMWIVRIVHWYLMQELDASERARILEECMRETSGLFLPIEMTSLEHRRPEEGSNPKGDYLVDEANFDPPTPRSEYLHRATRSWIVGSATGWFFRRLFTRRPSHVPQNSLGHHDIP